MRGAMGPLLAQPALVAYQPGVPDQKTDSDDGHHHALKYLARSGAGHGDGVGDYDDCADQRDQE